jgi:enediyne biosynthesis protein E3
MWDKSAQGLPASKVLRLRPEMIDLARRGFAAGRPDAQRTLDAVVRSFAAGYNSVLTPTTGHLDVLPHGMRGFAVEGAAMSSALLDLLSFSGGRRLRCLLDAEGERYTHLIHVGAGWAYARLHRRPWSGLRCNQPLFGWLAWDGWGFHQAFFHSRRVFSKHWVERATTSDVSAIRDQGVGRALWFYTGAEPARIARVIAGFPADRRSDLWAGIGLAASYTGAQPPEVLSELLGAANGYLDHVGQGAAFAAKAHVLSGAVPPQAARAIETLTGAEPSAAAAWTDACLAAVAPDSDSPVTYARWRAGIREAWMEHRGGVLQ